MRDGVKFYPVADIVEDIVPDRSWEEIDTADITSLTAEIDGVKKIYSTVDGITKILEKSYPPLGGFDLLLKGIVNVPKKNK